MIFLLFICFCMLIKFSVDSFDEEEPKRLWYAIQGSWTKKKSWLEHEYAVTGWVLSVLPKVYVNVASELTGLMIEMVVERLHAPPCPNNQLSGYNIANIIDIFWHEFKHWQNMNGSYASTPDELEGRSHIWHDTYSLPYTKVLEFVASMITSKRLGIGSGEHAWRNVKKSTKVWGPTFVAIL